MQEPQSCHFGLNMPAFPGFALTAVVSGQESRWRSELLPTHLFSPSRSSVMTPFFVLCAVIGGTILVCQFVLTLVGFGHDVGDMAHDVSVDMHTDALADAHGGGDGHGNESGHHGSSWLFGVISFRTI